MNNLSMEELLNKAFSLACFILGERDAALRTVAEAMARLDVTTAAQGKRLYYKPSGTAWLGQEKADRYRNKVLFSETHLLQRLVYIASEPYEERSEETMAASEGGQREMLIHYLKHLVRITTRRNSFYVTLGISRLLYNYTTAETMEVYNAVIQDPERVKDDYYYRSRKGVLMQELKKRFDGLISVARGPRGEERFHASSEQSRFIELVKEALTFFTPWYTPCLVPAGVNPIMDGIAGFESHGAKEEDKIEVDRIHAVLHPDCHGRLVEALGFDEPASRLEVPHFFLSQESGGGEGKRGSGGGNRRQQSPLSGIELDDIKGHLDGQSARRKKAYAGLLRVVVDGHERARLDLLRASSTRFSLDADAELIEVRTQVGEDDLLLASHLCAPRESASGIENASIVLEGGQKIALTVSPASDEDESIVTVAYRETSPFKAAALSWKRFTQGAASRNSERRSWMPVRVPALALALALLALCTFGVMQFLRQRNQSNHSLAGTVPATLPSNQVKPALSNNSPTPPTGAVAAASPLAPAAPVEKQERASQRSEPRRKASAPEAAATNETNATNVKNEPSRSIEEQRRRETVAPKRPEVNVPSERTRPESGATREMPISSKTLPALPLSEVRKIYVEVNGDDADGASLRGKLIENLNASGKFALVETKDEADALLRATVTGTNVGAVLINPRGETIWRVNYTGSNESVAAGIVKELLDVASKNRRH
ncbi:MAG: hypothetical protein JO360_05990 [Acidobacteria bacterium]|nr:hypothetical protein [Acidobacteriota bacterium]